MNFKKRRIRNKLSKIQKILDEKPIEKNPESLTENFSANNSPATNEVNFPGPDKPIASSPFTDFEPEAEPYKKTGFSQQQIAGLTIAAAIVLILGLGFLVISLVRSLDFGSLIFSFGQELAKDEHQKTNFLLIGTGGETHDGANLTDTLIVASLDNQSKQVKMISIPRDLYVDLADTGGQRINKVYDTYLNSAGKAGAIKKLQETVTEITGAEIQYYVKVDFNGFVKIIDALGGVEVNVETAIHDPFYPKGETIYYETFHIDAGIQTLDGETALKYARSRKTTSDFDRARRQQQLMAAVKDKALSLDLLTNPDKLQKLYASIASSLETDLTVSEILELGKISQDINRDQIDSRVLSDQFDSCGGFLYTPNREMFGGASVLLPAGNDFKYINQFTRDYFDNDFREISEIQVLNGTKTSGLAGKYLDILNRACLNVVYYGNASDRAMDESRIFYTVDEEGNPPSDLDLVKHYINAPAVEGIPAEYLETEKRSNSKIVIELGADYRDIVATDPYDKLLYTGGTSSATSSEAAATTPSEPGPEKPLNSSTTDSETEAETTESEAEEAPAEDENPAAPEVPDSF
ncbi:MAG: LCP family protein [Candidatus Altimarinota bacterium]